jgi:hypothetical protein
MPETTPLIKAALNLRVGAGFDVYFLSHKHTSISLASLYLKAGERTNLQKGAKNKRTTISNDTLIVLTANQGL